MAFYGACVSKIKLDRARFSGVLKSYVVLWFFE
jgi:hypothetical protein